MKNNGFVPYGGELEKPRHTFNLLDIIVLMLLLAGLGFLLYTTWFSPAKKADIPAVNAECTLFVQVPEEQASGLAAGDVLYDYTGRSILGVVLTVETAPYTEEALPDDGVTEEKTREGDELPVMTGGETTGYRMTVRVRMAGEYASGDGFAVLGQHIRIGDTLGVATARFASGEARVVDLLIEK